MSLGILVDNRGVGLTESNMFEIVLELFPKCSSDDIEAVKHSMRKFTAASYKSVLQKIIRFAPEKVEISEGMDVVRVSHFRGRFLIFGDSCLTVVVGKFYPADFVLCVTASLLLVHPGAFVPDIQRFVTGLESFVKRLVVIFFEDSFFGKEDVSAFFQLSVCSFLAQRTKTWKPTREMVIQWFKFAQKV